MHLIFGLPKIKKNLHFPSLLGALINNLTPMFCSQLHPCEPLMSPCRTDYFPTLGLKSSNASLEKFILVGNKKYIAAIFNIIDENKKYDDENNLLH